MSEAPLHLFCANHPNRETQLRCNQCEKPICIQCVVKTPTGYRCKDCVRSQQKIFDTAKWFDYPLALGTGAILAYLGSLFIPRLFIFAIFVSPIAGGVITEIIRALIRKRRSQRLFRLVTLSVAIGCLPQLLIQLVAVFLYITTQANIQLSFLITLGLQFLYTVLVTSTTYYRLSGIQIR